MWVARKRATAGKLGQQRKAAGRSGRMWQQADLQAGQDGIWPSDLQEKEQHQVERVGRQSPGRPAKHSPGLACSTWVRSFSNALVSKLVSNHVINR